MVLRCNHFNYLSILGYEFCQECGWFQAPEDTQAISEMIHQIDVYRENKHEYLKSLNLMFNQNTLSNRELDFYSHLLLYKNYDTFYKVNFNKIRPIYDKNLQWHGDDSHDLKTFISTVDKLYKYIKEEGF